MKRAFQGLLLHSHQLYGLLNLRTVVARSKQALHQLQLFRRRRRLKRRFRLRLQLRLGRRR